MSTSRTTAAKTRAEKPYEAPPEDWRVCRFCHRSDRESALMYYATRRYAHPVCIYQRKGEEAFDGTPAWKLRKLPVLLLKRAGLPVERLMQLVEAAELREAKQEAARSEGRGTERAEAMGRRPQVTDPLSAAERLEGHTLWMATISMGDGEHVARVAVRREESQWLEPCWWANGVSHLNLWDGPADGDEVIDARSAALRSVTFAGLVRGWTVVSIVEVLPADVVPSAVGGEGGGDVSLRD